MKKNIITLVLLISVTLISTDVYGQRKKAKSPRIPDTQKVRQTDYDSIWRFTDFNDKTKYFLDFNYMEFENWDKKTKEFGAMTDVMSFVKAKGRVPINIVALYAINPSIKDSAKRVELISQFDTLTENAIKYYMAFMKLKEFPNRITYNIADIDYRYWLSKRYFEIDKPTEDVFPVGLLFYFGTKKTQYFPPLNTSIKKYNPIRFFPNKSELLESYMPLLKDVASYLKTDDRLEIKVVGYSDNQATEAYGLTISKKRAEAVRDALLSLGVEFYRIDTEWKGAANPIGNNETHNGRAENNRVEIIIN